MPWAAFCCLVSSDCICADVLPLVVPPSALATSEILCPAEDLLVLLSMVVFPCSALWALATSDCIWADAEPLEGPPSTFAVSEMTLPASPEAALRDVMLLKWACAVRREDVNKILL